jgi:CelD/BcsL family acetyltransferase involved in cellulose biosynthesis
VRTADELDAISTAWDGLVLGGRRTGPFLLAGWVATQMRVVANQPYAIATAWRGEQLLAGFAVAIGRRSRLIVAEAIGGIDDYFQDLLFVPGETAAAVAVVEAIRSEPVDAVDYYGFAGGSALAEIAGSALVCHRQAPVLHAEMPDGFDAFLERKLSPKSRSTLRRKARHLDDLGGFSLERVRAPDDLMAALPDLFRLHNARWRGRPEDRSAFGDERRRGFQVAALERLAADGYARMVVGRVGSQPVAFSYWFSVGETMFSYRLAFDPHGPQARYSPGLLTFLEACRMAADEGVRRIEFGRGLEEYKQRLCDESGWLYEGIGLASTSRGRVGVAALNTALGARRAVGNLPFARRTVQGLRRELLRGRARLSRRSPG